MHNWQLAYLGRHTFPPDITDVDLRRAFTFDAQERSDICKAFRSRLRIAAALQLGFLRLIGTPLGSVEHGPGAVLRHLGQQFALRPPDLATLRAWYGREMTRFAHQRWAIDYDARRSLDTRGEELLRQFIRDHTHSTIAHPRLELWARDWMHRDGYLIPSARRLSD